MSTISLDGGTLTVAAALVDDDYSSSPGGRLTNLKKRHKITAPLPLTDGTNVVALSKIIHVAQAAGVVTAVEVTPGATPPSGGDFKWTVDVNRSTAAGAFATILSAAKDVPNGATALTPLAASLDAAKVDYIDGDLFQIVVTVSGSSGTQGQGGCVVVWFDEPPA